MLNRLFIYILLCTLVVSCSQGQHQDKDEHQLPQSKAQVTFSIGSASYHIEQGGVPTRGAQMSDKISKIWYKVFTPDGNLVKLSYSALSADLSTLCIEGLKDGAYTIAFLATTQTSDVTVNDNQNLAAQAWITNGESDVPLNIDLLYERVDFTVGKGMPERQIDVALERAVGLMQLNIVAENANSKRFIRKVEISFDKPFVETDLLINGQGQGLAAISNLDVTKDLCFYSLPSVEACSGRVKITSQRSDSTFFTQYYEFSNVAIVANQITPINVNWSHPEDTSGKMHIRVEDYNSANFSRMFQDTEPRSTMYNSDMRSFYVDAPLQVTVENNCLKVKFYSAIGIKDVKIEARFNKYSGEFFDFAHIDSVRNFQESLFEIPVTSRACTFRSADGRDVVIPALGTVSGQDITFRVKTDDPYMAKIAKIKMPWYIKFSPFGAEEGHTYWKHMEPMHCREACVLTTNMAFMFSTQEFDDEMVTNYSTKLLDDSGVVIPLDVIRGRLLNHSGFDCGRVRYTNGLGGGRTFGVTHEVWKDHYWDFGAADQFHKDTAYHELGHCIGYGHSSTMTYGDQWTVLCSRVMYDLGRDGKLPVNSRFVLNTGERTIE